MKKLSILIAFILILPCTSLAESNSQDMEIFTLEHILVESIYEVIDELKGDEGKVIAEPNTNSLIVVDNLENIERISQVIERLDLKPKQVEVEVLVTEITAGFLHEAGISMDDVVIPSQRYEAILNLMNRHSDVNVRTKMKVTTLSNRPARIQATKAG